MKYGATSPQSQVQSQEASSTLRSISESRNGNLWCVFGCGGERDSGKRPLMGKASQNADNIVITSDNSRNEEFSEILSDAIAHNNSESKIDVIEDRKAAIIHGTNLIKKDDCLVILGKGHEEIQEKDGQILFFSDHEVVNEIYN